MDAKCGKIMRILRGQYAGHSLSPMEKMDGHVVHMVPRSFITEASSACLVLEAQVCPFMTMAKVYANGRIVIPRNEYVRDFCIARQQSLVYFPATASFLKPYGLLQRARLMVHYARKLLFQ